MKTKEELKQYDTFIFKDYVMEDLEEKLKITYFFEIPNLESFETVLEIPKKKDKKINSCVSLFAFHIGLIELISYWKCCCPKNVIINCGDLNEEQKGWFKKLYFLGLGEFFYTNHLEANFENFMHITCLGPSLSIQENYVGNGCMVAIGGGKDSCVTLELLKSEEQESAFIINPKSVMIECAKMAGLKEEDILKVKRTLSRNILKLNQEGFLNGHTPFSAMVAFVSYLTAYLNDKKYIVLSNESSANEGNVVGTKVNHQYSKSLEFENDFRYYTQKYFKIGIEYFSLLRPLNEYQIGMLLSKMPKYHSVFKSCNRGSKQNPWVWCLECSKCLFAFCMLSPFLYKERLISIFGSDMFLSEQLLTTFQELLGYGKNKPFDCVGTYEEINYAITKTIQNFEGQPLPFLLKYYKEHYPLSSLEIKLEEKYDIQNNLNVHFEKIVKDALFHDKENCRKVTK